MKEYEIYLPTTRNDGTPIDAAQIDRLKEMFVETFGGYTYFRSSSEGAWNFGKVTFRDEVTIIRVLGDPSAEFDMPAFKKSLEAELEQQTVLIVERLVRIVT